MSEFLKSLVKSKQFKYVVGLIAAALAAYAGTGCADLLAASKQPRALQVLACQAEALRPYLGDAAEALVREINGNRAFSIGAFLQNSGVTPAEAQALAEAYVACLPDSAPEPAEAANETLL